jgi:hypothetical protein
MQNGSEYEQNAAACRQKAAQTTNLQLKKQLEEMAEVWDRLARQRQHGVVEPGQWRVAIYPPDDGMPKEKAVSETRDDAEATARSMINVLLKKVRAKASDA